MHNITKVRKLLYKSHLIPLALIIFYTFQVQGYQMLQFYYLQKRNKLILMKERKQLNLLEGEDHILFMNTCPYIQKFSLFNNVQVGMSCDEYIFLSPIHVLFYA